MVKITVLGGTGYAGSNIVAAAKRRGHSVTIYSRNPPAAPLADVIWLQGTVLDGRVLDRAFEGADIMISALSPRGALTGNMLQVVKELEARSASTGTRLGVVGGAASLYVEAGDATVGEMPWFPEEYKAEAAEMQDVLTFLQSHGRSSNWFCLCPPIGFGAFAPGELTGRYRVGDDVMLSDAAGQSTISGPDFGDAFIVEAENPAHVRRRFTVGY